jgi:hypothetical protein
MITKFVFWVEHLPSEMPAEYLAKVLDPNSVEDASLRAIGMNYEVTAPAPVGVKVLETLGFRGIHLPC